MFRKWLRQIDQPAVIRGAVRLILAVLGASSIAAAVMNYWLFSIICFLGMVLICVAGWGA